MLKKILIPVLAVAALFGAVPAASGHVELTPGKAAAGKPVKLALEVGHGCAESPTTRLLIQIPKGAEDVETLKLPGWQGSVSERSITWKGGSLPSDQVLQFPFRATLYGEKGATAQFKTIQFCPGGLQTAWIQEPVGGEEPENPTPQVTLTSSAKAPAVPDESEQQAADDQVAQEDAAATGEPTATAGDSDDSSSDDGGSDTKTILLIVVAGLAIGTIAGIIVRGRRSSS